MSHLLPSDRLLLPQLFVLAVLIVLVFFRMTPADAVLIRGLVQNLFKICHSQMMLNLLLLFVILRTVAGEVFLSIRFSSTCSYQKLAP